uniref:Citrate transporter-like domain-containing protein n=1 Tax=Tetradesmus obliquus TaxID=3088 RepID=A0A383W390_TETOB
MLATGSLNGRTLAAGIVGDATLKPYGILILFMALAYVSTSLDMTGCFGWLALHITRRSKGNGRLLFLLYFAVSSSITVFTSNDIAIMTLTPIIYYFSAATGTDAVPYLTAMFTAANIWSMLLFVGNPTNIIVAVAYQMSFGDYSRWMALPTLGAGLGCLAVLLLVHARRMPKHLALPDLQPALLLLDKPGAAFGSFNILGCLGLLAAAPSLGWELWPVTLVCAGLHAVYNFVAYVVLKGRWCRQLQAPQPQPLDVPAAEAASARQSQPAHVAAVAASTAAAAAAAAAGTSEPAARALRAVPDLPAVHGPDASSSLQERGGAAADEECSHSLPAQQDVSSVELTGVAAQQQQQQQLEQQQQEQQLSQHSQQDSLVQLPAGKAEQLRRQVTAGASEVDVQVGICDGSSSTGGGAKPAFADTAAAAGAAAGAAGLLQDLRAPSFGRVLRALPYEVVPFVLGMFILVEGLNATGWVDRLAWWLGSGVRGSVWAALFAVGSFSVLLANLANNQPMTILMTRVCMSPVFAQAAAAAAAGAPAAGGLISSGSSSNADLSSPTSMASMADGSSRVPVGAAFAVVIASNVAANFTVMGALAGIMFVNILQRKGLRTVNYATFSRLMLPSGLVSAVLALAILGAELVLWQ